MEIINVKTLQKKLGLDYGSAAKFARKIEKLTYPNPKAKIKVGYLNTDGENSLVLVIKFGKPEKQEKTDH